MSNMYCLKTSEVFFDLNTEETGLASFFLYVFCSEKLYKVQIDCQN